MKLDEFLLYDNALVIEALERLDKASRKILFVTDTDGVLVASLTDGDIRRWILSKGELTATIDQVAYTKPIVIKQDQIAVASKIMKKADITALPVVDDRMHVVTILFSDATEARKQFDFSFETVIMAGGFGKRLYPYTRILPKPLIPIGDTPIVERIMNQFHDFGSDSFHLIVNHKKGMIKAYFNEAVLPYNIAYIDEEKALGTAGGLAFLKGTIQDTFVLSNADILLTHDIAEIIDFHKRSHNTITMVCSMKTITIPYGVVEHDETGVITNTIEKPQYNYFVNTGIYIVEPTVLNDLVINEKIDFPDVIKNLQDKGSRVGMYPVGEGSWLDMGELDELEKMRDALEGCDD